MDLKEYDRWKINYFTYGCSNQSIYGLDKLLTYLTISPMNVRPSPYGLEKI